MGAAQFLLLVFRGQGKTLQAFLSLDERTGLHPDSLGDTRFRSTKLLYGSHGRSFRGIMTELPQFVEKTQMLLNEGMK